MRTAELLDALAKVDDGIVCTVKPNYAIVTSKYRPRMHGAGKTLFQAAFELAGKMLLHTNCPSEVKKALDDYEYHTACLRL